MSDQPLTLAEVVRAVSDERRVWDGMVASIPVGDPRRRPNEDRRDAAVLALMRLLDRLTKEADQ